MPGKQTATLTTEQYSAWYEEHFGTPVDDDLDLSEESVPKETLPQPVPRDDSVSTALLKLWRSTYKKTFGASYKDGLTADLRQEQVDRLLNLCEGDTDRARKAIKAMFSAELHWVKDISLRWLTKESNFTRFVVPCLQDKRDDGKRTDWKGARSKKPKVRIRRKTRV